MSFSSFSQVPAGGNSDVFLFEPVASQRVHSSDSVQIFATLITNKSVSNIGWSQVSGPALKITPTTNYWTGAVATASFWLSKTTPGVYVFKAVGLSSSGTTGFVTDTLTVLADPVCPPPVAQRVATAIQITINGQLITIPLAGTKITYGDGSVQ